jgi:DNA-binding beta-propeller fold protein YncE
MIFAPVAAPQPLAQRGPFAALIVDSARRRIITAGARSVAVLDADTGKLLATVRIGGARSLALEPLGGHIFVGAADGRITEIDPDRKTVVRSLDAGGAVDAMVDDAVSGRLYADGDARDELAVFDTRSFSPGAPIALPGGEPAQFVPDPITHELYVAFADQPEIAIVDPQSGTVRSTFPTPGLAGPRVLRFDDALGQIAVTGSNGVLDVYDRAGTPRFRMTVPAGIRACDLDTNSHVLACTGANFLTFVQLNREAAPQMIGTSPLPGPALVTLDGKTNDAFVARSDSGGGGAVLERWSASPPPVKPTP